MKTELTNEQKVEPLSTVEDVMEILRLKRGAVYRLVSECGMPAIRINRRVLRFRMEDVKAWFTARSV